MVLHVISCRPASAEDGTSSTCKLLRIAGILVMSAFFRLLACVAPSMVVAQSLGAFMLLILVISSGFAIVRGDIPGWCDTCRNNI